MTTKRKYAVMVEPSRQILPAEAELIRCCLVRVQMFLESGNANLCHATIDYHFRSMAEINAEMPLELIGIAARESQLLADEGIQSVQQLCGFTAKELESIRGIGRGGTDEISGCLAAMGLTLTLSIDLQT